MQGSAVVKLMYDVQAKAVAQHLKEYDIKRVYVSPFYRSVNAIISQCHRQGAHSCYYGAAVKPHFTKAQKHVNGHCSATMDITEESTCSFNVICTIP